MVSLDKKRRMEALLEKSDRWLNWSRMLIAANAVKDYKNAGKSVHIFSAIDTSEVIKYVMPDPNISMELRVALELLFGRKNFPLYLLPTHARELGNRIRAIDFDLRTFLYGNERFSASLVEILEEAIARLRKNPGPQLTFELVELIAKRVPPEQALDADRKLNAYSLLGSLFADQTVLFANVKSLGIDLEYDPDHRNYTYLYEELSKERPKEERRNICDAEALDFLRWINDCLPENNIVILFTRTNAIFDIIERKRQVEPEYFVRKNVPLIQLPGTALVQYGLFGELRHSDEATLRNHLTLARAESGKDTKKRLELLQQHLDVEDQTIGEEFLSNLETQFRLTAEAVSYWVNLAVKTVLVDPSHRRPNRLYNFLSKPDYGLDIGELLRQFKKLLSEGIAEVEDKRRMLYLSVLPESARWNEIEFKTEGSPSRVLATGNPLGTPTTRFMFQSQEIRGLLDNLESITKADRPNKGLLLRLELYHKEPVLKSSPEFYLLLSFVFTLFRDMWFQAYDAAKQGSNLLAAHSSTGRAMDDAASAITNYELNLAKAIALCRWGVSQHDNKNLCRIVLGRAKEAIDECLKWRQQNKQIVEKGSLGVPVRDYRCLRELSYLYGSASDFNVSLTRTQRHPNKREPGFIRSLREIALRYGKEGFRLAPVGDICYYFLANNVLYSLTMLATEKAPRLAERRKYAKIVEESTLRNELEPTILDTLHYHYVTLAKFETDKDQKRLYMETADSYRSLVEREKEKAHSATRDVIEKHKEVKL